MAAPKKDPDELRERWLRACGSSGSRPSTPPARHILQHLVEVLAAKLGDPAAAPDRPGRRPR
jgi:hypothetical protein